MAKKSDDEKGLGDILKKLSSLSSSSSIVSEESIKGLLKDLPVAKDIVLNVIDNAKGAKGEVSKLLQDEFRKYLGKVEVEKIVDYLAENYDIDAKLSFKKKEAKNKEPDS
jgi:hypothetical protein